ncbi:MAG: BCCT family transporter [Phycisphaerales bacterium]
MSDPESNRNLDNNEDPIPAGIVEELPKLSFGPHFEMHPVVFPAGALIVLGLVLLAMLMPGEDLRSNFETVRDWVGTRFGWLYVASMTGFLLLAVRLAFSRYGSIKLGNDDDVPEFSRLTWFTMLFSAGMGIGLVFWSVAEPIYHFQSTPPGFATGLDPSRLSMAVTIFHWGLHPWALYAVVGLALGYFGFRKGMPLGFRSVLYPIFGRRVWGPLGDAVDTLAIVATLTGVATSLGLGAKQVNAGFAFLFDTPVNVTVQVILIACITGIATVSVVLGLGKGIRRLSELNMALAGILMLMVIFASGVVVFLGSSIENTGAYLQQLPFNSFRTGALSEEGSAWLNSWTVFYWAWWISWSPFVGMFIARVSRGRTIREFIIGTLLVPTAVGILWLTAFGSTTLRQHSDHASQPAAITQTGDTTAASMAESGEGLPSYTVAVTDDSGELIESEPGVYETTQEHLTAVEYLSAPIVNEQGTERIPQLPTVLYALLAGIFDSRLMVILSAGIATTCIILFFVTSSDSASMVIDIIASGGNPDPPVGTRLFWAISEGLVAAILLMVGGLEALQAASITVALPFTIILILSCIGLMRSLRMERPKKR